MTHEHGKGSQNDRVVTEQGKPRRLGRGLSSLIGDAVRVNVPGEGARGTESVATSGVATGSVVGAGVSTTGVDPGVVVAAGGGTDTAATVGGRRLVMVGVGEVAASRWQPRKMFEEGALQELAGSIRVSGVMQPIVVRAAGAGTELAAIIGGAGSERSGGVKYELIAGERRLRAAAIAGLAEVPAVVVVISDQEAAEWGLVENVQRTDLMPLEKAEAFRRLSREFGLTHQQIADRVGLNRTVVTSHLLLFDLEEPIVQLVADGTFTLAHARMLLNSSVRPGKERVALATRAAKEQWSVRRLTEEVSRIAMAHLAGKSVDWLNGAPENGATAEERVLRSAHARQINELQKSLSEKLGTKVRIEGDAANKPGSMKGRLVIHFYDLAQFEGVLGRLK